MLERWCISPAEGPGKLKVPLNFQELQHLRDVLQLYKQVGPLEHDCHRCLAKSIPIVCLLQLKICTKQHMQV